MADDTVASTRQELETRITEIVAGLIDDTEIAQAIDALIAAVRAETLADYVLTDTDVDKFLMACEAPVDPERVERIRKLFQQKLDGGS